MVTTRILGITTPARSTTVLEALRAGGWYPGRKIDTAAFEALLASHGFRVSPIAKAILAEFYQLHFTAPVERGGWVEFISHLSGWTGYEVQLLESAVGKPSCLIATQGVADVFVSPDGGITMLDMDWLFIMRARDIERFFEVVFTADFDSLDMIWLKDEQIPAYMRQKEAPP